MNPGPMSRKYQVPNQHHQRYLLRRTHQLGTMSSPHPTTPNLKVTPRRNTMLYKTESRFGTKIKTCLDVAAAIIIFPSRSSIAFSAQMTSSYATHATKVVSPTLNEVSGSTPRSIISFVALHQRTQPRKFSRQSNDSQRLRAVSMGCKHN